MSSNFWLFIAFSSLIVIALSEALAIFMTLERGVDLWKGIVLGLFPIIGQIIAGLLKPTNTNLIEEMYDRELMTKEEYDKTMDIALTKKKLK